MIRLAEELLLLMLQSEQEKTDGPVPEQTRNLVLAGAVLVELSLANRVVADVNQLVVVDSMPLEDDLLDPILQEISQAPKTGTTAFWVGRIAEQGSRIYQTVRNRLITNGVFSPKVQGSKCLAHAPVAASPCPMTSGQAGNDLKTRYNELKAGPEDLDARDVALIGLASSFDPFQSNLTGKGIAALDVNARTELSRSLDLICRTVADCINQVQPGVPTGSAGGRKEIPVAPGLPLAGNAFAMGGDLRVFLTEQYKQLGPVFKIRAFNRRFVVLAGPEANLFVNKEGRDHLSSLEIWRDFDRATASRRTILSLDGPEHLRMRKAQMKGYSPQIVRDRLDEVIDITKRTIDAWPTDQAMSGLSVFQGIVAQQIGSLLTNVPPQDYIEDLVIYLETLLKTQVLSRWPKSMLHWPRYKRARRRVNKLYADLLAAHQPENRKHSKADFIDDLLALHHEDPQFFSETDLRVAVLGPYFAGLDTAASVCTFMLHVLLKQPDLLARMTAEVDTLFDRGIPTKNELSDLNVTHRVTLETLRMYPIVPGLTRIVSNSFVFGGFTIPAGTQVLIGNTVSHHLPECFPNPDRFDIDRYLPGRAEHRQPGAFAPFGVGRHRCLGEGFAEVQIVVTMATLVREAKLALVHPKRPLKINQVPAPHPVFTFKLRELRQRKRDWVRTPDITERQKLSPAGASAGSS